MNRTLVSKSSEPEAFREAFSLVEVLAIVAIIGIITFLAIPNLIQIKGDAEDNLAASRAGALDIAMAAFVNDHGAVAASNAWVSAGDDDGRYSLLKDYLAFAQADRTSYMPAGYAVTFPSNIPPLVNVTWTHSGG